ncbi:hypothetical protein [Pseudoclavibacter sp. AY1H1]|uniref:hypothetical protein n=1 Tax=Pseudoclavibacter sp. AY1H1 TaxID=2080584 RepID=UPI000CE7B3A8|nr:hypothetical protein [Pseudoclavibacter sp. AY1H1]PPF38550.1 hypothetical protein C5E05_05990 [Pseudoclavibacter sp. AY1H1]
MTTPTTFRDRLRELRRSRNVQLLFVALTVSLIIALAALLMNWNRTSGEASPTGTSTATAAPAPEQTPVGVRATPDAPSAAPSGELQRTVDGLVMPPVTGDPAAYASAAALALTNYNTGQATRDRVLENFVTFTQPTDSYVGPTAANGGESFVDAAFREKSALNRGGKFLPAESAFEQMWQNGGWMTSEVRSVRVDGQHVSWPSWEPSYNDADEGYALVTVELATLVGNASGLTTEGTQWVSFELDCDEDAAGQRTQCGVVLLANEVVQ